MLKWLTSLLVKGTVESTAHITTGGTSSDFVKGDGSLDDTQYVPYTGANQNIDFNNQQIKHSGHSIKTSNWFEEVDIRGATSAGSNLRKYRNVANYSVGSSNDGNGTYYIEMPLLSNTSVGVQLRIRIFNRHGQLTPTDLICQFYGSNMNLNTVTINGNTEYIESVDFIETSTNNYVAINTQNVSSLNYTKIDLYEVYQFVTYDPALADKSNWQIFNDLSTIQGDVVGTRTVNNDDFIRDSYLWNKGDFSQSDINNWNEAFGWGNHASAGYSLQSWIDDNAWTKDSLQFNYSGLEPYDLNELETGTIGSNESNSLAINAPTSSRFMALTYRLTNNQGFQFAYDIKQADNTTSDVYFRKFRSGIWGDWNRIWHTNDFDIADYATENWADDKFLLNTTDTLDGNLTVTGKVSANGGNSDQWNEAYGWGNHDGLYVPYTGANQPINLNTQKIIHDGIVSNADSITSPWLRHSNLTSNNKVAYLIIDGLTENTSRQLYIEVESVAGNGEHKRLVKGFNVNFTSGNIIGSTEDSRYLEVTGDTSARYGIGEVEKHSDTALKIPLIWLASTAQSINKISVKARTGSVSNLTFSVEYDATSTLTTEDPYLYRNASEKWVNEQGFLTSFTETDPIFTASPAAGISNTDITNWDAKGVQLTADQPNAKIHLKDIAGNILSTLDVGFLNNEGTTISFNSTTDEIELRNDDGDLLSSFPASALMTGVGFGLNLTGSTLELTDSANNVIDSVTLTISNIQGLQTALDGKALKTTNLTAGTGLTGGGTLAANRTIALNSTTTNNINKGVTAHGWGDHNQEGYATKDWTNLNFDNYELWNLIVNGEKLWVVESEGYVEFINSPDILAVYESDGKVKFELAGGSSVYQNLQGVTNIGNDTTNDIITHKGNINGQRSVMNGNGFHSYDEYSAKEAHLDYSGLFLSNNDVKDFIHYQVDGIKRITSSTIETSMMFPIHNNLGQRTITLSVNGVKADPVTGDIDLGPLDNYQSWNLKTNGTQRTTIQSGGSLDLVAGDNITLGYGAGGQVTIEGKDTTYTAGTGLILTNTQFSFDTAWGDGRYALDSHNHDGRYASSNKNYLPLSGNTFTVGDDLDTLKFTGILEYDTNVSNKPTTAGGALFSSARSTSNGFQLAGSVTVDDELFFRKMSGGSYSSWFRVASRDWVNNQGYLTSVGWTDLTGNQSAINLSGFNNDLSYVIPNLQEVIDASGTYVYASFPSGSAIEDDGGGLTFNGDIAMVGANGGNSILANNNGLFVRAESSSGDNGDFLVNVGPNGKVGWRKVLDDTVISLTNLWSAKKISSELDTKQPKDLVYPTIADMIAAQAVQVEGVVIRVDDAGEDTRFTFPPDTNRVAYYQKLVGSTASLIDDYRLISIDMSTGLEAIDEGNGIGRRLKGANPDNYGNIGSGAIDLGSSDEPSTTVGATGDYSTVSGGMYNQASGMYSVIGGGFANIATSVGVSTVSGGQNNEATGMFSTISGGGSNEASGDGSAISGGAINTASSLYSTVGGGFGNTASGEYSTAGGGNKNEASGDASTVGGGQLNEASGTLSTVGGGSRNIASGDMSTVGGGRQNEASDNFSTIGGGAENISSGIGATIPGGVENKATSIHSTVGGGSYNTASGSRATVNGGTFNEATGDYSAVGGGRNNIAKSFGEFLGGLWSTIRLGSANTWIATDRIFGIGNGKSESERSDAFNVYKNGVAELPSVTNSLITSAGPKTIPTKEWTNSNFDKYTSWNLKTNGVQRTTVQSGGDLDLIAGDNITLSYAAGGKVTIKGNVDPFQGQNLQSVTDLGNTTSNAILSGTNPTEDGTYGYIQSNSVGVWDGVKRHTSIEVHRLVDRGIGWGGANMYNFPSQAGLATSTIVRSVNGILANAATGNIQIPANHFAQDLQEVTDNGNRTDIPIGIEAGSGNNMYLYYTAFGLEAHTINSEIFNINVPAEITESFTMVRSIDGAKADPVTGDIDTSNHAPIRPLEIVSSSMCYTGWKNETRFYVKTSSICILISPSDDGKEIILTNDSGGTVSVSGSSSSFYSVYDGGLPRATVSTFPAQFTGRFRVMNGNFYQIL